jgi:dipeptidyl-peptidase 4
MVESFPRQNARTRGFSLGLPRGFQIAPDGSRVAFLRTKTGSDPVTCLWVLDVESGEEHLVADPAQFRAPGEEDLPPEEKARRERVREQAGGIVSYACDRDLRIALFGLAGRVYAADLTSSVRNSTGDGAGDGTGNGAPGKTVREVPVHAPAVDPRPDPAGRRVAYVSGGALRVTALLTKGLPGEGLPGEGPPGEGLPEGGPPGEADRVLADPADAPGVTFGLAEFIAAEEMNRTHGYWWAPDGSALIAARVDETPVQRWYIADPANPGRPAREVAYPAAGTPNASVSLVIIRLDGTHIPVSWDTGAFPYLVTVRWQAGHDPVAVVQTRDQREMRLLRVDPADGSTGVLHVQTDPAWVDIVPGVPAWTAAGDLIWTRDADGARRLVVAPPDRLADAEPVTPPDLQVRGVLDVDGDTVLLAASADTTEVGLWTYGPDGLAEHGLEPGVLSGRRTGGTTVTTSRSLRDYSARTEVFREGVAGTYASIQSRAERPNLPVEHATPRPEIIEAGPRGVRTAVVYPSWHQPGSARLPVLMDPYGGPHGQRVVRAAGAYLVPQWLADQGFAVVIADGRGTPARGPEWERAVRGDLAVPVLEDQVDALHAAAETMGDLDLSRVGIRGWSFGGYLAALAVLRRPDVFHAAVAGAPVTEWRLYDTHYTERYLGHPDEDPDAYDRTSLLPDAGRLERPLLLIHGLADDNVAAAHTLRLSSALLAAGRPHSMLPLSGVTHMTPQEEVAENLLLLQVDFLRRALGVEAPR